MSPVQSQEHNPLPEHPPVPELRARVERGGAAKYHEANAAKGKLFARERVALLVDEGSFVEDGAVRQRRSPRDLPADGVVTGTATIDGRPVCLMANDSTVKAGSWGARTVEKIIRIIERAYATGVPMVYLVDSAGARITDQVDLFPGRRGAGQDLLQPGARVAARSRRCARCSGRRRPAAPTSRRSATSSSWSRATPRCTSAPTGWSRWSPARRPRSRRWAAPGCTAPSPASGTSSCKTEQEALDVGPRATCPTCRRNWQGSRRRAEPRRRRRTSTCARWCRRASGRRSTCAATSRACSTRARSSRSTRCGPGR